MINEKASWDGVFEINIRNKVTGATITEEVHNRLMNASLQELLTT